MNELLAVIKTALKISDTSLDTEISRHISAALKELERVGIVIKDNSYSEPLIISAVELYTKWQYDYLGQGKGICGFEKCSQSDKCLHRGDEQWN